MPWRAFVRSDDGSVLHQGTGIGFNQAVRLCVSDMLKGFDPAKPDAPIVVGLPDLPPPTEPEIQVGTVKPRPDDGALCLASPGEHQRWIMNRQVVAGAWERDSIYNAGVTLERCPEHPELMKVKYATYPSFYVRIADIKKHLMLPTPAEPEGPEFSDLSEVVSYPFDGWWAIEGCAFGTSRLGELRQRSCSDSRFVFTDDGDVVTIDPGAESVPQKTYKTEELIKRIEEVTGQVQEETTEPEPVVEFSDLSEVVSYVPCSSKSDKWWAIRGQTFAEGRIKELRQRRCPDGRFVFTEDGEVVTIHSSSRHHGPLTFRTEELIKRIEEVLAEAKATKLLQDQEAPDQEAQEDEQSHTQPPAGVFAGGEAPDAGGATESGRQVGSRNHRRSLREVSRDARDLFERAYDRYVSNTPDYARYLVTDCPTTSEAPHQGRELPAAATLRTGSNRRDARLRGLVAEALRMGSFIGLGSVWRPEDLVDEVCRLDRLKTEELQRRSIEITSLSNISEGEVMVTLWSLGFYSYTEKVGSNPERYVFHSYPLFNEREQAHAEALNRALTESTELKQEYSTEELLSLCAPYLKEITQEEWADSKSLIGVIECGLVGKLRWEHTPTSNQRAVLDYTEERLEEIKVAGANLLNALTKKSAISAYLDLPEDSDEVAALKLGFVKNYRYTTGTHNIQAISEDQVIDAVRLSDATTRRWASDSTS